MKINESNRINAVSNQYKLQQEIRTEQAKGKRRKDEVQISKTAMEMHTTSQTTSPERAKRVEELKQAVASGTYHVEAGKLAEKMLPYLK